MTNTRDPQYTGPSAARTAELALWRRPAREALVAALDGLGRTDDCWFARRCIWLGIRAAADLGDVATAAAADRRARSAPPTRSPVLDAHARELRRRGDAARRGRTRSAFARRGRLGPRAPPVPGRLLPLPRGRGAARAAPPARGGEGAGRRPRGRRAARRRAAVAEIDLLARRGRIDRVPPPASAAEPGAGRAHRDASSRSSRSSRRGLTNRDVGEALFVTEKTASAHVSSILSKLSVRSRSRRRPRHTASGWC